MVNIHFEIWLLLLLTPMIVFFQINRVFRMKMYRDHDISPDEILPDKEDIKDIANKGFDLLYGNYQVIVVYIMFWVYFVFLNLSPRGREWIGIMSRASLCSTCSLALLVILWAYWLRWTKLKRKDGDFEKWFGTKIHILMFDIPVFLAVTFSFAPWRHFAEISEELIFSWNFWF